MAILPEYVANIADYQEWERRSGPSMQQRYADFMPRDPLFEVRPDDIAASIPGYRIQQTGPDLLTVSAPDGHGISIRGLTVAALTSALSLLVGGTSISDLARAASPSWPLPVWCALLQGLLGTAVDLPAVFSMLTATVTRTEIVRFAAQPPRAVWRSYWENAAAVRRHLPEFYRSLDDSEKFRASLARLHVLATVGENGQSYYGGYGLIPTVPGGYREIAVQTAIPKSLIRTLDHWSSSLGAGPINADGQMETPRGQVMNRLHEAGTIVVHPTIGNALFAQIDEARLALKTACESETASRSRDQLRHLAVFHQIFVNAHPFANINNSIAMNIVNDRLRKAGFGHTPHLFLDYLAQRLPPERYTAAFAKAVELHALREENQVELKRVLANSASLYQRYRADHEDAVASPI